MSLTAAEKNHFDQQGYLVKEHIYSADDLRYQNMDVPNNIDEAPQSYTPERDPVTMACYPPEADFVLRDTQHPEREVHSPEQFHRIREAYVEHRAHMPGRGWKPMVERGTTP
jgi:hypothetical protein